MYSIKENYDLLRLKNKIINQIIYGLNVISLIFDGGYIQICGAGFSFEKEGKRLYFHELYPVRTDFGLLTLLEEKISNVEINDPDRDKLTIEFANGSKLYLEGNSNYEAFIIEIDGDETTV